MPRQKNKVHRTAALVAKQIRSELKEVFGRQRFSVAQVYSNTQDRLYISWHNGPAIDYVKLITDKYNRKKSKPVNGFGQVDDIGYLRTNF